MITNSSGELLHKGFWTPPTQDLIYFSTGLTKEELDRFVDLCCHYDGDSITPSCAMCDEYHGLAGLGLIDIIKYDRPVTLRITLPGKEVFAGLKRHDPISLINSCIRLEAWGTAAYLVWALLSAPQLPEFLTHDNKEIRDLAAKRLNYLQT